MSDRAAHPEDLSGWVLNIQRYCSHDGPGIRTTVFLKGCSLRCKWCSNPESIRPKPELAYNPSLCVDEKECEQPGITCKFTAELEQGKTNDLRFCSGCATWRYPSQFDDDVVLQEVPLHRFCTPCRERTPELPDALVFDLLKRDEVAKLFFLFRGNAFILL